MQRTQHTLPGTSADIRATEYNSASTSSVLSGIKPAENPPAKASFPKGVLKMPTVTPYTELTPMSQILRFSQKTLSPKKPPEAQQNVKFADTTPPKEAAVNIVEAMKENETLSTFFYLFDQPLLTKQLAQFMRTQGIDYQDGHTALDVTYTNRENDYCLISIDIGEQDVNPPFHYAAVFEPCTTPAGSFRKAEEGMASIDRTSEKPTVIKGKQYLEGLEL